MSGTTFPRLADLTPSADRFPSIKHCSSPHAAEEIHYRTARSREDLQGAFVLLQRRYQQAGLTANCDQAMRIMPYQLSPASQVFVATLAEQIVGTVTMVVGQPQSLPLASSYPQAMAQLQLNAPVAGEIAALAIDPMKTRRAEVFIELSRLVTHFARAQGLEELVAVVHPRHSRFYQHVLGFDVIGDKLPCELVCGRPGVAVLGHVSDPSRVAPAWRTQYLACKFSEERLRPHPITIQDRIHFAGFTTLERRRAA